MLYIQAKCEYIALLCMYSTYNMMDCEIFYNSYTQKSRIEKKSFLKKGTLLYKTTFNL
jgi:hypothetical protein